MANIFRAINKLHRNRVISSIYRGNKQKGDLEAIKADNSILLSSIKQTAVYFKAAEKSRREQTAAINLAGDADWRLGEGSN